MSKRFIDRLTSEQRKEFPMATGFVDYFPDAMAAVSHISFKGNQKHNPGQSLRWTQNKSSDHADCIVRHESTRTDADPAYAGDPIEEVSHAAEAAWRAMAQLQILMQQVYDLSLPAGAGISEE